MKKIYTTILILLLVVFQSCVEQTKHQNTSRTRYLLTQIYDNSDSIHTAEPTDIYKFKVEHLDDTLGNILYYNGKSNNFHTKVDTFEIKDGKKHKAIYSYIGGKHGKIDIKEIFNDKGDLIETYSSLSESEVYHGKASYQYNSKNQLIKKTYYQYGELLYIYTYKYNENLLVEEFLEFGRCCDRQQPVPVDKTIYFYNKSNQKIRECDLIDPKVKRNYKKSINAENYATIGCTVYTYDSLGRIKTKCALHTLEDSIAPNKLLYIDNLTSYDSTITFYQGVCDSFVYQYIDRIPLNYK